MEFALHHPLDLVSLVQAQQTVVHKDTGEPVAHGLLQQGGSHGAVYAAGEGQQHTLVTDLFPALPEGGLHIGLHSPLTAEAADTVEEILQDFGAVLRVYHLRVELHAVELLFRALHRRMAAAGTLGNGSEAGGGRFHLHPVAHPVNSLFRHPGKEGGGGVDGQLGLAVFPGNGLAALAAQKMHHQLHAVADAQHRDAQGEQGRIHRRCAFFKHRGRAAGEDQRIRPEGAHLIHGDAKGLQLAVNAALAHPAGHQQIILPAKIQNQNLLHWASSLNSKQPGSALSMIAREWML